MKKFSLVHRLEVIEKLCTGKRVLHLGCTDHPYTQHSIDHGTNLHLNLEKIASEVWGIDSDPQGIEVLKSNGSEKIVLGDLERLENVEVDGEFDIIVAGEMIEHLSNPGLFLGGVKKFMTPNTTLLITTINAYCGMRFFYYGTRGRRGRSEPVHPDHVAYYSYSTLTKLLERFEIDVENFLFYDIGPEHRQFNRWYINFTNDVCVRIAPQWADGVIALCKLPPSA